MPPKAPRPPTLIDRVKRAGNFEGFGDAFDFQNTISEQQLQDSARAPVAWPIGQVQTSEKDAARLAAMLEAVTTRAFAPQGARAFDYPKPSAAIHESGHAVFYAQSGVVPSKIAIWSIVVSGEQFWIGRNYGVPNYRIDSSTSAESDLKVAQESISGVAAECLFDREYRIGSSLDEIVLGFVAVSAAASKMRCDVEMLWSETCNEVATILKANEGIVHKIAIVLMQKGAIEGERLGHILRGAKSR